MDLTAAPCPRRRSRSMVPRHAAAREHTKSTMKSPIHKQGQIAPV